MYSFITTSLLISNPFVKEIKAMALCATFYPIDDSDILLKSVCIRGRLALGRPTRRDSAICTCVSLCSARRCALCMQHVRHARVRVPLTPSWNVRVSFKRMTESVLGGRERRRRGEEFYYRFVRLSDLWSARISGILKRFEIAAHLIKYVFLIIRFIFWNANVIMSICRRATYRYYYWTR